MLFLVFVFFGTVKCLREKNKKREGERERERRCCSLTVLESLTVLLATNEKRLCM